MGPEDECWAQERHEAEGVVGHLAAPRAGWREVRFR